MFISVYILCYYRKFLTLSNHALQNQVRMTNWLTGDIDADLTRSMFFRTIKENKKSL